ncbi:MAG: PBP1A family penicillin-binding protein [Synergistaceae bacterium]|nr:PBP1A family penicillin-binding protein [Synergistaceae bacterium]MBR0233378.1 PBP1A family penicillin-binding protein [Synergistaceae bacterium]MBR0316380.1 PBP1A family penicillin-binding protein [Synergistaceae bacterium]
MNERNNSGSRGRSRNFRIDPDELLFRNNQRQRAQMQEQIRNSKPVKVKKRKKKRFSILKIFFMTILLVILLATGALSAGVAYYVVKLSEDLPSMIELANPKSSLPSILYDRNGEVIARLFIENRTPLELSQISPNLIRSVLAAEDSAFYQHGGIRIGSILRALWTDIVEKGKVQGASTITQQLARNLFLSHEKSITRKAKEIIIAMRLEKLFPKDKILELYLNTINFGRGAWGAETAARTYFDKSAKDLDLAQSSILAGLIANPGRYNPLSSLSNAKARQNYVLGRMETLGWITPEQRDEAYNEELEFRTRANKIEEYNRAPYFVSHLLFNDLLPKYGKDEVYSGGMQIYTTLDVNLQDKAREAIQTLNKNVMGALVCIEAKSGEVLALVGGKDFKESKFNRATQAIRQPGSSFKPIVYAAAMEEDVMPSDHFLDAPITFKQAGSRGKGWSPHNSSKGYSGEVTLQRALTSSLNTVAVRVAAYIGTEVIVQMARNMGIETKYLPNDLSIALGSASLTPLEMAVAFNCFNNGGKRIVPLMIREIRDRDGNIIEQRQTAEVQAMRPETAYAIRSMLQDAVRAGTGKPAAVPKINTFGKTGTSNDFIDAWFVGGIPGLTTAVYVGRDDHKTMGRRGFGGTIAAPIWKSFMTYAAQEQNTPASFENPPDWADVEKVSICRSTGYLARSGCQSVPLYFPKGKAPTASCPTHGGSYKAADNDPRGPRLFLVEQDETYYANMGSNGDGGESSSESSSTPSNSEAHSQQVTAPATQAAIPKPAAPAPQRQEPKLSEVEQRYRQLLKEYGLE